MKINFNNYSNPSCKMAIYCKKKLLVYNFEVCYVLELYKTKTTSIQLLQHCLVKEIRDTIIALKTLQIWISQYLQIKSNKFTWSVAVQTKTVTEPTTFWSIPASNNIYPKNMHVLQLSSHILFINNTKCLLVIQNTV